MATGAAAETPHFSSNIFESSAASMTVSLERLSTISCKLAIYVVLLIEKASSVADLSCRLAGVRPDDARKLSGRCLQHPRHLGCRRLNETDELGSQFVQ